MSELAPEKLAELLALRADLLPWLVGGPADQAPCDRGELRTILAPLPALMGAAEERDALAEWRDFSEAELEALRATLEGRCLSDITHRDEEHRQSVCILPADHRTAHDDAMGTTWTDANHWQPDPLEAERDALAAAVERVRELHKPEGIHRFCSMCAYRPYPCPTICALDESEADSA